MNIDIRIAVSEADNYPGHVNITLGIDWRTDIRGLVPQDADAIEQFVTANLPTLVRLAVVAAVADDKREAAAAELAAVEDAEVVE